MNPAYRPDMSQHTSLPAGTGYQPALGRHSIPPPAPPNPYIPSLSQQQYQHTSSSQHHHPYQPHRERNHLPPVATQPPPSSHQPHPSHQPLHSHQLNPVNLAASYQPGHHAAHLAPPTYSQPHETRTTSAHVDQQSQGRTQLSLTSLVLDGLKYTLEVRQQPQRARMCGYGDKDRRPITPPPCVRLFITDTKTGQILTPSKSDFAFFVLNVDLWNEAGTQEVNLCRQPSSAVAHSVPSTPSGFPYSFNSGSNAHGSSTPMNYTAYPISAGHTPNYQAQQHYSSVAPSYSHEGGYTTSRQYFPSHQQYRAREQSISIPPSQHPLENGGSVTYVQDQYKGALNRNLIGNVSASAFHLHDPEGKEGIWFVLQDLSVRLEGTYRLKFSFINVGPALRAEDKSSSQTTSQSSSNIVTGRAPILASCFSEKFDVYSAKKFPGVCESTLLSKTFATQGIKIPIRKDGNKAGDEDDGE